MQESWHWMIKYLKPFAVASLFVGIGMHFGYTWFWGFFVYFCIVMLTALHSIFSPEARAEYHVKRGLLKNRVVILNSGVEVESVIKIVAQIAYLNILDSTAPIYLYINSPGGDERAMYLLANSIVSSKAPIIGVVIGEACSAAAIVLQLCKERLALPYAQLLFHKTRITHSHSIKEADQAQFDALVRSVLRTRRYMKLGQDALDEIVLGRSGLTIEQLERIEEEYLTPTKAFELNLVDRIVEKL